MPTASPVLTFCVVAALLTVTPGADTMLVLRNSLRGGRRDGWATALGIGAGLFVHAVFSALGLSLILARSAAAFQVVKFAGAAYLVWLGLQAWWRRQDHTDAAQPPLRPAPLLRSLREGFLTNVLNPKVAVFYLAFLPQFVRPGDPVLAMSLLYAGIHLLMGLVWLGSLAVAVAAGRRWLDRPAVRRGINRVAGTVLVALGVRLAFEEH